MASIAVFAALVALLVASSAAATSFDVSDGHGWETGVDYTDWTSDKTFAVGDTLVFNYTRKAHTVTEVSKSGYDACSGSTSLSSDDSGSTTVTLTTPGVHYFICAIPGHCSIGMKLAVTVVEEGGLGSSSSGAGGATGATRAPGSSGAALVVPPAIITSSVVVAAVAGALTNLALF